MLTRKTSVALAILACAVICQPAAAQRFRSGRGFGPGFFPRPGIAITPFGPAPVIVAPTRPYQSYRYDPRHDPRHDPRPEVVPIVPSPVVPIPAPFPGYGHAGPGYGHADPGYGYAGPAASLSFGPFGSFSIRTPGFQLDAPGFEPSYERPLDPGGFVPDYDAPRHQTPDYGSVLPRSGDIQSLPSVPTLPSESSTAGMGSSILQRSANSTNALDAITQLRQSVPRLRQALTAHKDGEVWLEYLRPDDLDSLLRSGQLSTGSANASQQLSDIAARFQGVVANPDLAWLRSVDGFEATHQALVSLTSDEESEQANAPVGTPSQKPLSSENPASNESLPAPQGQPTIAAPIQDATKESTTDKSPTKPAPATEKQPAPANPQQETLPPKRSI